MKVEFPVQKKARIEILPLIDIVFLLLVFFVWTASFHLVEQLLPSNLIAAAGQVPGLRARVVERVKDKDPPLSEGAQRSAASELARSLCRHCEQRYTARPNREGIRGAPPGGGVTRLSGERFGWTAECTSAGP